MVLFCGVIYVDFFCDNVLWDEVGCIFGVFDFYFVGEDCLLFDLVVVVNDWCFNYVILVELLVGYCSKCWLNDVEMVVWLVMWWVVVLCFWLFWLEV